MTNLPLPTSTSQYLSRPSPQRFTHQAVVQTVHHRGDAGSDNVWPPTCTSLPGEPVPLCFSPHPPSHTTTPSFFPTTLPVSTTTQTVTQTAIPSSSGNAASTTLGNGPTTATMPVSSSGFPLIVPDDRGLTTGELVGVITGSIIGALLLLLFLWLLRRGTFGSGTLFGFRYGDARKPGWDRAGSEMRQKGRGEYFLRTSEPLPSSGSTLFDPSLSLPGTKPPSYSRVLSSSSLSLHKPPPPTPPSPPHWSTSSSAFDNAYPVSSSSARTRSHTHSASASASMSVSISDNSTLVSEPTRPRPPARHPNATASDVQLRTFPNVFYHGASMPLPRRPPSPGGTVSTSMVSFDQSAPGDFEVDPSEVASSETRSEWEVDTAESEQPLRLRRGSGGAGGRGPTA